MWQYTTITCLKMSPNRHKSRTERDHISKIYKIGFGEYDNRYVSQTKPTIRTKFKGAYSTLTFCKIR